MFNYLIYCKKAGYKNFYPLNLSAGNITTKIIFASFLLRKKKRKKLKSVFMN